MKTLVAAVCVASLLVGCKKGETQSQTVANASNAQDSLIALAQDGLERIKGRVPNPASATFQNVTLVNDVILCGSVTAKGKDGHVQAPRDFETDGANIFVAGDNASGDSASTSLDAQSRQIDVGIKITEMCTHGKTLRLVEIDGQTVTSVEESMSAPG